MTVHTGTQTPFPGGKIARLSQLALTLAIALCVPYLLAGQLAAAAPRAAAAPTVVISQVYGGGGNSGAPLLHDFIELFNRDSVTVPLGGWSVQVASAAGASWQVTPLPAIDLPPGGYLLIREASGGPNGSPLPAPDVTGMTNLGALAGKVALVSVTAALNVTNPAGLAQVVDFVGYGSAGAWEGAGPAPAPSVSASLIRNLHGCMDSGDNADDFATNTPPIPRNRLAPVFDCNTLPAVLTSPVQIAAFYIAGYVPNTATQGDEAVLLMNVSADPVNIGGWRIGDGDRSSMFPGGTLLAAGGRVWAARRAPDFRRAFGFAPQFEMEDADGSVPDLIGALPPQFADAGDEVLLLDDVGAVRDAAVYGTGSTLVTGWIGAALQPYVVFPMLDARQVFVRKRDAQSGYPLMDTHRERDWSVSRKCSVTAYGPVRDCDLRGKWAPAPGQRSGYLHPSNAPGEDWVTFKVTENAQLAVLVGPDHLYEQVSAAIAAAQHSILIEGYTLHSPAVVAALAARAAAGISLTILLEGDPCCEVAERQKNLWAAHQISAAAGGQVYFMADSPLDAVPQDRYANQHAKFTLIDAGHPSQLLLIGTENLNCSSMPPDAKDNGTEGNRGYYLRTNAPSVVAYFERVFRNDLDPAQQDIAAYGTPPYVWDGVSMPGACADGTVYTPLRRLPLTLSGIIPFEVVQCPDNCLRQDDALIGMVLNAHAGDVLLVQQAYERTHWGTTGSSAAADPNPRLEAYIEAARRGARVRILLDALYENPTSTIGNSATAAYVNAFSPTLDIAARLVDVPGGAGPAGNGIHAKIVLLNSSARGRGWLHVGSINGSEASSKANREIALQVESLAAVCYVYDVFRADWLWSGGGDLDARGLRGGCPSWAGDERIYLPLLRR